MDPLDSIKLVGVDLIILVLAEKAWVSLPGLFDRLEHLAREGVHMGMNTYQPDRSHSGGRL